MRMQSILRDERGDVQVGYTALLLAIGVAGIVGFTHLGDTFQATIDTGTDDGTPSHARSTGIRVATATAPRNASSGIKSPASVAAQASVAEFMAQFGRNLTELARSGDLAPVVGREAEIERAMEVLGRYKKNNPLLLGEPGVGKTAVV
ncbi:MAG: ATP-dependent Clp protease ATP-binding subunit, partial [Myxococcales bacterium]|nr:ATP-dependent Clp protease ATP-binding subunit [Myxococcales bacterium]